MLGEHRVGLKNAGSIKRPFGDDALPFAEQVRQNSFICDRQFRVVVRDLKCDREVVATLERARLD